MKTRDLIKILLTSCVLGIVLAMIIDVAIDGILSDAWRDLINLIPHIIHQ